MCEHDGMVWPMTPIGFRRATCAIATLASLASVFASGPAQTAGCSFETQGEGHVAGIIDARTLHLQDGRDISLAGIVPVTDGTKADRTTALSALVAGHEVTLRGQGRYAGPLRPGARLRVSCGIGHADSGGVARRRRGVGHGRCGRQGLRDNADGSGSRRPARQARLLGRFFGHKKRGKSGDILTGIGRFTVVEGRVLSVRQTGGHDLFEFRAELDAGTLL